MSELNIQHARTTARTLALTELVLRLFATLPVNERMRVAKGFAGVEIETAQCIGVSDDTMREITKVEFSALASDLAERM